MHRLMIAAAALAAVNAPGLASAGAARQQEIHISGYDLTRASDVVVIERHIEDAVDRVCRGPNRPLAELAIRSACKAEARAEAMQELEQRVRRARAEVNIALK